MTKFNDVFDIADQILGGVEKALGPSQPTNPGPGGQDVIDVTSWTEIRWYVLMGQNPKIAMHHASDNGATTRCGIPLPPGTNGLVMEYGRALVCCSSCVIGVTR